MNHKLALNILKESLSPDEVLTDKKSLYLHSFDAMKLSFLPTAVVRPSRPESIGCVLKVANAFEIPVTARGAGSSLTGSATPLKGGYVLDLSRLNDLSLDAQAGFAYAQAGVITRSIQQLAESHHLFYPPDPSSSHFCTIGGNIACNAGGLRGLKYGVTRDYVVALKGYLPTGEFVSWGLPLKKYASGYNLKDLWIGSEGTLGVITEAVLKLIPKPPCKWTCLAKFSHNIAALNAAKKLLQSRILPSIFEFMDALTVASFEKQAYSLFQSEGNASFHSLLLIELDGHLSEVSAAKEAVTKWAKQEADAFLAAEDEQEAVSLWEVRRQCSSAMFEHGDSKLNEDVVVPLNKTVLLMELVEKLSKEFKLKIPTFGHIGDGNFHVNIMYSQSDQNERLRAQLGLEKLMEGVVKMGGAISGEHGIGLAKGAFFKLQHSEVERSTMRKIKTALDPKNILNPEKIFNDFHPWDFIPVKDKMPWEQNNPSH